MQLAKKNKNKPPKQKVLYLFLAILGVTLFSFSSGTKEASAACLYPSQILDLSNWKETLPIGPSESPTEIKQPTLATYSKTPFFIANATCDGVIFRAPVNGVTTSGSGYPRSELREMTNRGATNASWSTTSGAHSMTITQAITAVPKSKKHVVAGQIHDSSDDVIVIRLEYPKLFIDINGTTGPTLDANYALGKKFTVQFVAAEGKIKVHYNGNQQPVYTLSKSNSGNYFKAGAYTQSNCSKEAVCDASNYGEVVVYNLKLQHQTSTSTPIAITPSPTTTTTTTSTTATTSNQTPSGMTFEAESGSISGGMVIMTDDGAASGGKYIRANSAGSISYAVNILESGKYKIAGLIKAANTSSDSFYVSFDNNSATTWVLPISPLSWILSTNENQTFSLSAGIHKLTVKYREANSKIDKVMLIKQ